MVNIKPENEQHTQSTRISPTLSTTARSFFLVTNLSFMPTVLTNNSANIHALQPKVYAMLQLLRVSFIDKQLLIILSAL